MRQSFKSMMLGGAILLGLTMCLTSCEGTLDDIFGEWSRPTGNNGNTKTTVAVKSVTLDQTTLTKAVGDDAVTLTATVDPTDASDKTVTWKSSDESVATVADGVVTFVAAGTATITATAPNGTDDTADDKTAECAVTVNAAAAKVTTAPTATTGTIVAGSTTALVTAGVADGGTMMYEVTATNAKPTTTDGFSATVPTAATRAAGTYYVWYYAKADATHVDSEIAATAIEVTVTEVYAANEYNEGSWDSTNKKVVFTKQTAPSDPIVVTTTTTSWDAGWYTVSGNVTINGDVKLTADTHLILQDGATLTINGQLDCRTNKKNLYIYGQKKGDGKLNVTNNGAHAINSYMNYRIDIHGGEVTAAATGDKRIGLNTGYLAVYGGKLTATSGGGNGINFQNTFDVYGGEVEATSNATSSSNDLCGIRSGGGSVIQLLTVYGGKVTATGNGVTMSSSYGSGIGCYVMSGTSGIKFYFSEDGNTWGDGTSYASATSVGLSIADAATKKRYVKAE